jgi:hypothetical protein
VLQRSDGKNVPGFERKKPQPSGGCEVPLQPRASLKPASEQSALALHLPQHGFPQPRGIAFAALAELNNFPGDGVGLDLVTLMQAENAAYVTIGARHHGECLGLERLIPKQMIDSHGGVSPTPESGQDVGSRRR